jgi:hypothetical protein
MDSIPKIEHTIRYDDDRVLLTGATDGFGKTPAEGYYLGGAATRNAIYFTGNVFARMLFQGLQGWTDKNFRETARCYFSNQAATTLQIAWRHDYKYNETGVPNDAVVACDPPPNVDGTQGIGGVVTAWLSLDLGQHWVKPGINYTYLCGSKEYFAPSPRSSQGPCTACPPGAVCNGSSVVGAYRGWYEVSNEPFKYSILGILSIYGNN